MGFFGFSSKKEVEKKVEKEVEKEVEKKVNEAKQQGADALAAKQNTDLGNLAKGSQVKFAVPYFDVFDPRFMDLGVPVSVHGSLVYYIPDLEKFKNINKVVTYKDEVFEKNLKDLLAKYIKYVVSNAPTNHNIPVLQIERKILEISDLIQTLVAPKIEEATGIIVRSLSVSNIIIDTRSRRYKELKSVTADLEREILKARHNISLSNLETDNSLMQEQRRRMQEMNLSGQEEMQHMQLEHQRETMRIQREEMQRASRLQTESNFLGAHQVNLNAEVNISRAENGGGMSCAQMSMSGIPQMPPMPAMPGAVPQVQYMVGVNGQQVGPCNWQRLQQMVQMGQLTCQSYVWKQGMSTWELAGNVSELQMLFM